MDFLEAEDRGSRAARGCIGGGRVHWSLMIAKAGAFGAENLKGGADHEEGHERPVIVAEGRSEEGGDILLRGGRGGEYYCGGGARRRDPGNPGRSMRGAVGDTASHLQHVAGGHP